jgi:hydroxyacylglutathione hydrolase
MLIERIWAGNDGRNYHYLIACEETGEALLIDPLNAEECLARARALGVRITQIFNTHEHRDHTGGNAEVVAATGAPVLAHDAAADRIGGVSRGLKGGDVVRVGRTVELTCIDTPGHTRAHLCLFVHAHDSERPALFSGDTLFNAGVGNCLHGGDPQLLYETFTEKLARLPDATRIYPGHDYLLRNLSFTLDREPSNSAAKEMARQYGELTGPLTPILTLGQERQVNAFLRLGSPEIIGGLFLTSGSSAPPAAREVFLALRALRNRW